RWCYQLLLVTTGDRSVFLAMYRRKETHSMPPRRQRPKESPALIAFGGQMRRMREAKGITQQSIADHTNISKAQVSRIENGTRRATRSCVEQVDRLLRADGALVKLWDDLNRNGHPVPL